MKKDLFHNKNIFAILKLLFNKVRLRIYLHLFKLFYYLKLEKIPLLPISLDVEPTNRCNFRCPHCQLTYWSKKNCDLNLNSLKTILTQFPNLNFIKLQGIGEPFLCKEFCDMLEYVESKLINIDFTTNGSIESKKFLEIVKKLNRTQIRFSIDGVNEHTLKKMRPEANFNKILDYASQILVERGNKKQPKVIFWMVLTKHNINEIDDLIILANKLNIDCVGLQTTLHDWAKEEVKEVTENIAVNYIPAVFDVVIEKAKRLADSFGIELMIENSSLTIDNKCKWPFNSAFIAANGDVVPCCWISDSSVVKMGNIFEQSFDKIWNSEAYQDLRRSIKKHELKDFCKSCYNEK